MFWSSDRLMSYNRFLSVAVGARGTGKTYSCKMRALKREKSTVWVRRYAEDIKPSNGLGERFLADLPPEIRDSYFYYGNAIWKVQDATEKSIEKDSLAPKEGAIPKITFVALSTARRMKSQSWHNYDLIVFDEFIESSGGRYLSDEYAIFLDLLETICRLRTDIRVLMCANNVSLINPYFAQWGIGTAIMPPEDGKGFRKVGKDVIIEWVKPEDDYLDAKLNSAIGRLSQGTQWANMSVYNLSPTDEFYGVEKRPTSAKYKYSVRMSQIGSMGVWEDSGVLYMTREYDASWPIVVTDEPDGIPIDYMLNYWIDAYIMGKLRFDSVKSKFAVLEYKK